MNGTGTVAAILAAGQALRFGGDKMWTVLHDKPLVQHAIATVLALEVPTALIVAPKDVAMARMLSDRIEVVSNAHAEAGMGSSIACAARWAMEKRAGTLLLSLGDMPFVTTGMLADLVRSAQNCNAAAIAQRDGTPGPPVAFTAEVLSKLAQIEAARGAKHLLAGIEDLHLHDVDIDLLFDVDTGEDRDAADIRMKRAEHLLA
ncbi:MAG: nucleotidyltransferase family protein [Pontixanthobacter sp.]